MIKTDYKPRKPRKPIFSPKKKTATAPILMISVAILFIAWGLGSALFTENEQNEAVVVEELSTTPSTTDSHEAESQVFEIELDLGEEERASEPAESTENSKPKTVSQVNQPEERPWVTTKIRSGDSTAAVFKRHKLSPTDLYNIMQLGKETAILKRVQVGHQFDYLLDDAGKLVGIRYYIDKLNKLEVSRNDTGWSATTHTKEVEFRQASASGTIKSSLFLAGKSAGMSDALVMELAGIFGWDIDFILDIRQGDKFTLIYEEKFVDGEKYANGDILAAEFVNQGKAFRAVLYTDSDGNAEYFSPDGYSMRKAFLRAPVDFSRVSSGFNPRRFHPVTRRVAPHRGIDYVAPIGTPIKAAGDGKVIRSAYDKLNGHHVFIQHGQKYTTKYLHFQKRKVRTGQRVKQGQIIGTLGRTGRVTGAHLHYEFLVNGVHRNPKTVKLPDAEPVAKSERPRFRKQTKAILAQLDKRVSINDIALADAD